MPSSTQAKIKKAAPPKPKVGLNPEGPTRSRDLSNKLPPVTARAGRSLSRPKLHERKSDTSRGMRPDGHRQGHLAETSASVSLPNISHSSFGSGSGHRQGGGRKTLAGGSTQRRATRKPSLGGSIKEKHAEVEKAAAIRIQTWWKLKFYNRNFFLVIKKAAEYARKEEEERVARAKQAKATLSKFFLKAIQRFREKTKEAKRKKRVRAAEMVHRLLLWRQARHRYLVKEHLRQARAVKFIFKMWKQSKIFARVRWRVADETLRQVMEDSELLERRHLMVQQKAEFDGTIVVPHHQSEIYLAIRRQELEDELEAIRAQEDEIHSALLEEAMYGAPHTSSVATIQRQLSVAPDLSEGYESEFHSGPAGVKMPKFSLGTASPSASAARSSSFSPRMLSESFASGHKINVSPTLNSVHRLSTFGSVRQIQSQRKNTSAFGDMTARVGGARHSLGAASAGRGSFFSPTAEALISPQTRNIRSASAIQSKELSGVMLPEERLNISLPQRLSLSSTSVVDLTHRPRIKSSTTLFTKTQPDALFMRPRQEPSLSPPHGTPNRTNTLHETHGLKSDERQDQGKPVGRDTTHGGDHQKIGLSHAALGPEWADWFTEVPTELLSSRAAEENRGSKEKETPPMPVTAQGHQFLVERGLIQEHRRRQRLEDQWLRLLLSLLHREEDERNQVAAI